MGITRPRPDGRVIRRKKTRITKPPVLTAGHKPAQFLNRRPPFGDSRLIISNKMNWKTSSLYDEEPTLESTF